ncbi:MAG: hypothetical protein ACE5KZ_06825 [Candidatus Scalinduaceae bacterium]
MKHDTGIINKYVEFTKDELLLMFQEEAHHICTKPEEVHSIAVSALDDFIKKHGKYVGSSL